MLRKAALLACEDDAGEGPEDPIRVTDQHLATALDQLLESRNQLTRVLLGGEQPSAPGGQPSAPGGQRRPGAGHP